MSDYAETDRLRRQAMETASGRLLEALCREHPHIINHLQQQQRSKRSPNP